MSSTQYKRQHCFLKHFHKTHIFLFLGLNSTLPVSIGGRGDRLIEAQFRKIFLQSRLSELVIHRTAYIPKDTDVRTGSQCPQYQSFNCLPFILNMVMSESTVDS